MEISHWPECESLITAFSLDAGVVGLSVSCGAGDKRIDAVLMFDKTRIFSFDCVEAGLFLYQIKSSFLSLVFLWLVKMFICEFFSSSWSLSYFLSVSISDVFSFLPSFLSLYCLTTFIYY